MTTFRIGRYVAQITLVAGLVSVLPPAAHGADLDVKTTVAEELRFSAARCWAPVKLTEEPPPAMLIERLVMAAPASPLKAYVPALTFSVW